MAQPLQAGISQVQSFDDVIVQPNYQAQTPDVQAALALDYFDTRVATQPNFQKANPQAQEAMRQDFKMRYRVPDIQNLNLPARQGPIQGLGNIARGLGGWAASLPSQIGSAVSTEVNNSIQNPYSGLEKLAATPAMLLEGVRDFAQAPADLFAAAQNAYTGTQDHNPIYNLPSTRDLPFVGDWIGQTMDKYPVYNFAAGNAIPVEEGLGLLGKAFKRSRAKAVPRKIIKGKPATRSLPKAVTGEYGLNNRLLKGNPEQIATGRIERETEKFIQDAEGFQGVDAKTTTQKKVSAYKKAFDQLQQRHDATTSQAVKAKIKQAQEKLKRQYEKHQPPKTEKVQLDPSSETFNAVAKFVKDLRKEGKVKEADIALGQYEQTTKAKLYDTVKAQEKAESQASTKSKKDYEAEFKKLLAEDKAAIKRQRELEKEAESLQTAKDKQAIRDRIAFEKAETKNRRRELKRLRGDIKEQIRQQKAEQVKAPSEPKEKPKKSTGQTNASKLKEIRAAIDKKHDLDLEYEAEKHGETSSYRNKVVSPYSVEINKNGVIQMRAINQEGQIRTYLLGDESGSKIVSAKSTGKKALHEAYNDPDSGKLFARTQQGEVVKQVSKTATKSSELRANIEKMESVLERVKKGGSVTAEEIRDAVKPLSEDEFKTKNKSLPRDKINEIGEKVDC